MAKKISEKASKKPSRRSVKKRLKKPVKKSVKKAAAKSVKTKSPKSASNKTAAAMQSQKSTTINPYLTFNGNCEEAFNFYKSVFGGEFGYLGRFKEMPAGETPLPESDANKIMHVSLAISKETVLMGSDTAQGFGPPVTSGNNFSISINTYSQVEADRLFNALSAGGNAVMPMHNSFWGSYFGMLVDKFGFQWMISVHLSQSK